MHFVFCAITESIFENVENIQKYLNDGILVTVQLIVIFLNSLTALVCMLHAESVLMKLLLRFSTHGVIKTNSGILSQDRITYDVLTITVFCKGKH